MKGGKPMKKTVRGIVLITTMLLLSFIIMIAALLIVTGRNTLMLGASYSDREQAHYAAECGLAYVQYCITRCAQYQGGGIYNPGFTGLELEQVGSSNCIHGRLPDSGAEFYVAFCDGTGTLGTANAQKCVDLKGNVLSFYSFNNLAGTSKAYSVRFDGTTASKFKTVPNSLAHIIVEGRCNQARRYVEAILTKKNAMPGEACSITAGDIEIQLSDTDSVFLVNSKSGNSSIRSMGNIKVTSSSTAPNANDKNCFQIADKGTSFTGNSSADSVHTSVNNTTVTTSNQGSYDLTVDGSDQGSALKKAALTWDNVSKDYITSGTFNGSKVKSTIKSGTYVYRNSPTDTNTYKLYYYDTAFDPASQADPTTYKNEFVNNNKTTKETAIADGTFSSGSDITMTPSITKTQLATSGTYLFKVTNPVGIDESDGNKGFSLLIYDYDSDKGYTPSEDYRTSLRLGDGTAGKDPALITMGGTGRNVYIDGELSGSGKVLAAGSLDFQGGSLLETDPSRVTNPNQVGAVSTYANGDVSINPVRGSGGTNGVNDAIKAAWTAYTATLGTATNGYFDSTSDNYQKIIEKLLATPITGTYTDSTGRTKTYNDATKLSDVLGDTSCFTYDSSQASELVAMMLSKNSYIGSDTTTTAGSTTQDISFGTFTSCSTGTAAVKNAPALATLEAAATPTVTIEGTDYYVVTGKSGNASMILLINTTDSNIFSYAYNNGSGTVTRKSQGATAPTFDAATDVNTWKFTDTITAGGNKYTFKVETSAGGNHVAFTGVGVSKTQDSTTVQLLDKDNSKFKDLVFNDTKFSGLVYTHKNIFAPDMQGGSLTIHGGLVAYGGDPASFDPTLSSTTDGRVKFQNGKNVTFTYDPDYLTLLLSGGNGVTTKPVFKASF